MIIFIETAKGTKYTKAGAQSCFFHQPAFRSTLREEGRQQPCCGMCKIARIAETLFEPQGEHRPHRLCLDRKMWNAVAAPLIPDTCNSPGKQKIDWAEFIHKYREEARMDVLKYSETIYNPVRCHSSLGNIGLKEYGRRSLKERRSTNQKEKDRTK